MIKYTTKINTSVWLIIGYIFMIINYKFVLSVYFAYDGYSCNGFSILKLIQSLFILIFVLIMYSRIRNGFYKLIYTSYIVSIFYGQLIFYLFNKSEFVIVIFMLIPLITLFIGQKFDKNKINKDVKLKLSDKFTLFAFVFFILILTVPYFKNVGYINFKNLLLKDIYVTRSLQGGKISRLLGYLFFPITRVLLPFIYIYSLEKKKRYISIIAIITLLFMFLLNGALKSIVFGVVVAWFFYKGSYKKKEVRLLKTICIINMFSLLETFISKSCHIADYLRRVFFVPSALFETYFKIFNNNHTYFLHSRISKILGLNVVKEWIPLYIGENILGKKGLSANVGIFTEGFLSFGVLGVLMASIIFSMIIIYLNNRKLSPAYFGIFFAYIYVINTAFVETLFITHGLLFYLIFAKFVIPKEKPITHS